jgi:hypothetical protein
MPAQNTLLISTQYKPFLHGSSPKKSQYLKSSAPSFGMQRRYAIYWILYSTAFPLVT